MTYKDILIRLVELVEYDAEGIPLVSIVERDTGYITMAYLEDELSDIVVSARTELLDNGDISCED